MWFLNCRSQPIGGDVTPVRITDGALSYPTFPKLLADIRGQHLLIGIHGFNVAQAGGIDHLQQWDKLLTLGDRAVFLGGLWPGDSTWLGAAEYAFAAKAANRSGDALAAFINTNFAHALSISFVSHSLGARVALRAVQHLVSGFTVRRLIMMAPAVDDDCLTKEFAAAARRIGAISLLASDQDNVLKLAYPLGNPISGIFAQGHPYFHGALGREGPKSFPSPNNIQAGWLLPGSWKVDHSDYLPPQSPFPTDFLPTPYSLPVNFPVATAAAPYPNTPQGYYLANQPRYWQSGWTAAITSMRFQ